MRVSPGALEADPGPAVQIVSTCTERWSYLALGARRV